MSGRAFVLVHGGRHGSWCWRFVVEELTELGHQAVAVDLALEDATAGAERFAATVAAAAELLDRPVTVVGHSMGGLVIPLVPELAPVEELTFVCSPLPVPGRTLWQQVEESENADLFVRENLTPLVAGRDELPDQEHAIHTYYHDLPDELARWAAEQLRPQRSRVTDESSPLREWPRVPSRYVLGTLDRIVDPAWARREVPRRLGIAPIELATGHSPFLARPRELVQALLAGPAPEYHPSHTDQEVNAVKVVNCPCGKAVEGETDDDVVASVEAHLLQDHPNLAGHYTREQILSMAVDA
jgi:pimeloyl-ACP methyl ester carboxylesterase